MAVCRWLGTSSTSWSTGANWSTGSAPGASDIAVFSSTNDIVTGTPPATSIAGLRVTEGFTGTIGTSSSPMNIAATEVVINCPNGAVYITGASTTMNVIACGGATPGLKLTNSTVSELRVSGVVGSIEFVGTGGPSAVYMFDSPFATLTVPSTASNHQTIVMNSGTVVTENGVTHGVTVEGGTLTINGDQTVNTITQSAGVVNYNSSGTLTTATVRGGTFSLAGNPSTAVTITNCKVHDGTLDERSGMANVTYTNDIDIKGRGTVLADVGRTVAIS